MLSPIGGGIDEVGLTFIHSFGMADKAFNARPTITKFSMGDIISIDIFLAFDIKFYIHSMAARPNDDSKKYCRMRVSILTVCWQGNDETSDFETGEGHK